MSETRRTGPTTGTYLFVRPPEQRRVRQGERSSGPPPARPLGPREPAFDGPEPPSAARLRHRRPRLEAAALDGRLVFFLEPQGEVAAGYREAAARLVQDVAGARCVWVTAPSPGAGRTTTALNLASALAETMRVTLVDLDFAAPGVARAFGLEDGPGLRDFARARRRDRAAPIDLVLLGERLTALTAGTADEAGAGGPALRRVLEEASGAADLLLVDGPVAGDAAALGAASDLIDAVVLVVRPLDLATGACEAALGALAGRRLLGVIVNDAPVVRDGPDA